MILVDTSIWISFLGDRQSAQGDYLEALILANEPLCVNGLIEMEILQGIRSEKDFRLTKEYLRDFQYYPNLSAAHFEMATSIFRTCRRRGVTVRRSIDCLIAANALLEDLTVLHHARDFDSIASVFPELQAINVS